MKYEYEMNEMNEMNMKYEMKYEMNMKYFEVFSFGVFHNPFYLRAWWSSRTSISRGSTATLQVVKAIQERIIQRLYDTTQLDLSDSYR